MSDAVSFTLSRPFSANRMFARQVTRRGHRNLTPDYKAWRDEQAWEVKRQTVGVPQITCRYDMLIVLPPTRMDTDNPVKPIGDLMQLIGLISDDRNLHGLVVEHSERADCLVVLTLRPDLPGRAHAGFKSVSTSRSRVQTRKPTARQVARFRAAGGVV